MPNKTDDWCERLLDRHPSEPVPTGFLSDLRERLAGQTTTELSPRARNHDPQNLAYRWLRPLLAAVAAVLLVGIGYLLGVGSSPEFQQITVYPGTQMAQSDLDELFQNREILQSWDLTSDADLELTFRQLAAEEDDWISNLLEQAQSDGQPENPTSEPGTVPKVEEGG
jgi:hypothetical protein